MASRIRFIAVTTFTAIIVSACGTASKAPPAFDRNQPADAQAATFIKINRPKHIGTLKKVAVTGCNVMFAQTTAAHAGTGGGLFSEAGGSRRAEAKVSVLYTMTGLDDASMQRMTDEVCANVETRLRQAGYEVVPRSTVRADEAIQALHAGGRASPFEFKQGSGDASVRYKVFAPTGYQVFDERFIGVAGGLGQAFRAAGGNATWQHETRAMHNLGVDSVNVNFIVDFAQMQSSGQGAGLGGLASRNRATVDSSVELTVTGEMSFKPHSQMKCWKRFGKTECEVRAPNVPQLVSNLPVSHGERFYDSITNTTTTGDRAAAVITRGLSMLAAVGGIGGVSSTNITRYEVAVAPARFTDVARRTIDSYLDMAMVSLKQQR